jgi:hypothetical protein
VNQPVSFVWGQAPHSEFFNGYITDVTENSAGATGALTFGMTVMGATKAMFTGKPRFWDNKTIPSAIADLVAFNLLGYLGHDHIYTWSGLSQTEESDWEMAIDLASRLGWVVFNRYGVVLAYDPLKLFSESGVYTRLVMGSGSNFDPSTDRNLLEFQPQEQSTMLNENLGVKYGYFTSGDAVQVISQPGTFQGYTFNTNVVIESQDAAQVYIGAATSSIDRWQQYALARVWGDADLYPGLCVEVVSTNTRYLKTKFDGKWLIRQATHQMDRQSYQTLLFLTRPNSTTPVSAVSYTPFWSSGPGKTRPRLSISEGDWVSSWANSRLRSLQ